MEFDAAGHLIAMLDMALQGLSAFSGAVQAAPAAPVAASPLPGSASAAFSIAELFMKADLVGKSVIILLAVLSLWTWAIIVEKFLRLRALDARTDSFEQEFWSGRSLDELNDQLVTRAHHPLAVMFVSAMREWRRSFDQGVVTAAAAPGVKDRLDRVMNVTIGREMAQVERQLGFLATVGATAPFIGLFGTVWGIMNSFRAIAATNNTSLVAVAPGISEALFATALGLLAAVPAVIAYNIFIARTNRYAGRLEGFADEFSAILSRQIDERAR